MDLLCSTVQFFCGVGVVVEMPKAPWLVPGATTDSAPSGTAILQNPVLRRAEDTKNIVIAVVVDVVCIYVYVCYCCRG